MADGEKVVTGDILMPEIDAPGNVWLCQRELMAMVKFGADEILRMDDSQGLTDESIDELLRKGEERTEETNARIQKDMQVTLIVLRIRFDLFGV